MSSYLIRNKLSREVFNFNFSLLVNFVVKMPSKVLKLLAILISFFATTIAVDFNNYRLPNTTIPHFYNIWLTTYIHQGGISFSGELTILVEVLENTPEIVVHAHDLAVTNIYLFDENMKIIEYNLDFTNHEKLDFVIATPKKPLLKGERYRVFFSFIGNRVRNDGKGFFLSTYMDDVGRSSWSGSFQAAPIFARSIFPCFDEPWMKSKFLMKVMHGNDYHAISNMPVNVTTTYQESFTISWFEESAPIPASKIGFVVSNFDYVEDTESSIPLRIYAKQKSIANHEANFALESAGKLLEAFESYFGMPLSLKKMDFAAVKNPTTG